MEMESFELTDYIRFKGFPSEQVFTFVGSPSYEYYKNSPIIVAAYINFLSYFGDKILTCDADEVDSFASWKRKRNDDYVAKISKPKESK